MTDEMVTKLRHAAEINRLSAVTLKGFSTINFYPEHVRQTMLAYDKDRDLGEIALDDAVFLEAIADLVESGQKATTEQLDRLHEFADEQERWAVDAQDKLDDYDEDNDDEEPDDNEDDIQGYRDMSEFYLSVIQHLTGE